MSRAVKAASRSAWSEFSFAWVGASTERITWNGSVRFHVASNMLSRRGISQGAVSVVWKRRDTS
ncbi:Uncharacterised protein [Mycobacteroides abscessus subsp. abscessus]|nr:Uncharacterised protein [Mycobacteroides abscessus subsp. abscessus]